MLIKSLFKKQLLKSVISGLFQNKFSGIVLTSHLSKQLLKSVISGLSQNKFSGIVLTSHLSKQFLTLFIPDLNLTFISGFIRLSTVNIPILFSVIFSSPSTIIDSKYCFLLTILILFPGL